MARRVTLDQLAQMIARGFEDVHRKFESVDRKFESVDRKFEDVHRKLDSHTETLAEHTAILERHSALHADHSHRLDRIERKLDSAIVGLDDHDVRIQALERRRGSKP